MPIHSSAVVSTDCEIHPTASIGPFTVIDAGARIGPGVRIGPFCHLYAGSVIEAEAQLFDGACVGAPAQDLKAEDGPAFAVVGKRARLREFVTVHRSARAGGATRLGAECLIMAYAHVAHDCEVGERAILANGVQLGGHVRIGREATVSGMTGVHQFTRIGAGAFVAGAVRVDQDVPPFAKAMGSPLRLAGTNGVGLRRWGWSEAARRSLEKSLRLRAGGDAERAASQEEVGEWPAGALSEWREFWSGESRRGICLKGVRPSRG